MVNKNNESTDKMLKEQKAVISETASNAESEVDLEKEQDYQKLVNLMNCIQCMPNCNAKVEMYQQVADKFSVLSGYNDADECAKECKKLAEKTDEEIKKEIYKRAMNKKNKAKQSADYGAAADEFRDISGYLNADDMILECEQMNMRIENKKTKKRMVNFGLTVFLFIIVIVGAKTSHAKYYLANTFMLTGSYNSAINMYTKLGAYKDCETRLIECQYRYGLAEEADGDYETAEKAFTAAGDYKDSEEQNVKTEKSIIKNSKAGDFVYLGKCKWEVLEVKNNQVLLLKKTAMPGMVYNTASGDVTWEKSSLRQWLNSDFLNDTFSGLEQKNIILSDIKNDVNETYGTDAGIDTQDYTFLLSIKEAKQYSDLFPVFKNNSWLRSPGYNQGSVAFISVDGSVMDYGYAATSDEFTVRPALWFNINS